jgi:hypothetical protein
LSDPIKRKLSVFPAEYCGNGLGASPGKGGSGGAAAVGNKEFKSTVGPGEGVEPGKNGSSVGSSIM